MSTFFSFLAWPLALPFIGKEGLGMPTFTSVAQQWKVLHDLEADAVLGLIKLVPDLKVSVWLRSVSVGFRSVSG